MSRITPRKDTSQRPTGGHRQESPSLGPQEAQLFLFNGFFSSVPDQSRTLEHDELIGFLLSQTGVRKTPEPLTRLKEVGGHTVKIQNFPASIQMDGKKAFLAVPAAREQLVERTIRKLAVQQVAQAGLYDSDQTGRKSVRVMFTLYQLRKELRENGHGYKISEIKTALEILSRSTYSVSCPGNEVLHGIESPIFAELTYVYANNDKEGQKSYVSVSYHPLATQSILNASFWPVNFRRVMRLKSALARWLTERISHHYRQADRNALRAVLEGKGYHISLRTILAESGAQPESRLRDNIAQIRVALQQMKAEGVLHSNQPYMEEPKTMATRGRSKVVDVVWTLFLSQAFTEEILAGNVAMKDFREQGGNRRESLALGPLFSSEEGETGANVSSRSARNGGKSARKMP